MKGADDFTPDDMFGSYSDSVNGTTVGLPGHHGEMPNGESKFFRKLIKIF